MLERVLREYAAVRRHAAPVLCAHEGTRRAYRSICAARVYEVQREEDERTPVPHDEVCSKDSEAPLMPRAR